MTPVSTNNGTMTTAAEARGSALALRRAADGAT